MLEEEHPEGSPLRETAGAKELMKELITQLREGIRRVQDPRAQAMLETSAEVIRGLVKAFDEYEKNSEV
jgi:hypothetical protein